MRDFIYYLKDWNTWRKYNQNGTLHHILVLLRTIHSPTFECYRGYTDAFRMHSIPEDDKNEEERDQ